MIRVKSRRINQIFHLLRQNRPVMAESFNSLKRKQPACIRGGSKSAVKPAFKFENN
jgi:hypothetical protein